MLTPKASIFRVTLILALALLAAPISPGRILADDAPEPAEKIDPVVWDSIRGGPNALIWHVPNVQIGSLALAGRRILIGGHDGNLNSAPVDRGRGLLLCVSNDDGKPIWRAMHDALTYRINDMVGVTACTPFVDGDRVFYVSNRGELCCVRLDDGHTVWSIDMPKQLGIFKRDPNDIAQQSPSPIVVGNLVYCVTGNGLSVDQDYKSINRCPDAPSFIAVDKRTGKMIWSSNAPGKDLIWGQWATPAYAAIDGAGMVLFPGGDGFLYAFEPLAGKLLWKVDCRDPGMMDFPDFITAPPLVVGETAVVSPAYNIDRHFGNHRLLGIDLRHHSVRWQLREPRFRGSLGTMAVSESKEAIFALGGGIVVALNPQTGKRLWTRDVENNNAVGGLCLHEGRLYLADDEEAFVLSAADGKILHRCDLPGGGTQATPIIREGKLFIAQYRSVVCIRLPDEKPAGK